MYELNSQNKKILALYIGKKKKAFVLILHTKPVNFSDYFVFQKKKSVPLQLAADVASSAAQATNAN